MIEDIVQNDEELMMKYLEGEELSTEELITALRKAYLANKVIPVLLGSAGKNIGISQLLDFGVQLQKGLQKLLRKRQLLSGEKIDVVPAEEEPLVAYIFKSVVDPLLVSSLLKLLSGTLKQGRLFLCC